MGHGEGLTTWDRLVRFAASDADRDALADDGLILGTELRPGGYGCTPTNTVAFAWTGGDGVHFSLVDLGEGPSEASPVVMTVPMALGLQQSWIVGATLAEMLALGLHGSYFGLEQLAYDPDRPTLLARGRPDGPPEVVDRLAVELGLAPWPDVAGRLAELHWRFWPLLEVPAV